MNKLLDNLQQVRDKHYVIEKERDYNEFVGYYEDYLGVLYAIFSKYYTMDYPQFIQLMCQTI
jgi:hypothetical protein